MFHTTATTTYIAVILKYIFQFQRMFITMLLYVLFITQYITDDDISLLKNIYTLIYIFIYILCVMLPSKLNMKALFVYYRSCVCVYLCMRIFAPRGLKYFILT